MDIDIRFARAKLHMFPLQFYTSTKSYNNIEKKYVCLCGELACETLSKGKRLNLEFIFWNSIRCCVSLLLANENIHQITRNRSNQFISIKSVKFMGFATYTQNLKKKKWN